MIIDRIDHLVLTVRDIDATCDFYTRVLGMQVMVFAGGHKALLVRNQGSLCALQVRRNVTRKHLNT